MAHDKFIDKRRRKLNLRDRRVEEVLPEHFAQDYPKFISLLTSYYEFENENDATELIDHLFEARDISQTDLNLLAFIEDELLLGDAYFEGFPDPRASAAFSSVLFRSKGSKYSIEWFFRSFFSEDVEVIYPKKNIFNVGEAQIGPDSLRFITDDALYQTFAILIKSGRSISEWKEIYKLFVHPAGMYLGGEVLKIQDANLKTIDSSENDTRLTPSYSISAASADEGSSTTVNITATNSPDTTLKYYIEKLMTTSVDFSDSLPFSLDSALPLDIASNSGSVSLSFATDEELEGNETFAFLLYDYEGRKLDSANINILDVVPEYTVNITNVDPSNIVEGTTITGEVSSTDPSNELITMTVTGAAGSDSRVSTPTNITMSSSPQPFSITTTSETVRNGSVSGAVQASSVYDTESDSFTIIDGASVYDLFSSSYQYSESTTPTIIFNVRGENVPSGTYNIRYGEEGTVESADFSGSPSLPITNTFAVDGTVGDYPTVLGTTNITLTDETEPDEWFTAKLYDPTNVTKLDSVNIKIIGAGIPTYSVAANDVQEGDDFSFTLTPTNQNGEFVDWTITGLGSPASDLEGRFSALTGQVVADGVKVVTVPTTSDTILYGSESGQLDVEGVTSGNTSSDTFSMTDDVAVYSLGVDNTSPDEGDTLTFTINGSNWNSSSVWIQFESIVGPLVAGDFENPSAGTVAPISAREEITLTGNPSSGTYTIDLVSDETTEASTESFVANIYAGSAGGSILASTSIITVTDTSQDQIFSIWPTLISGLSTNIPDDPAVASLSFFRSGILTEFTAPPGGNTITGSGDQAEDWIAAANRTSTIGDDYQVRALPFSDSGLTTPSSSNFSLNGSSYPSSGSWQQINATKSYSFSDDAAGNQQKWVQFEIKEYSGVLGTGTTVLTHTVQFEIEGIV